MVTYDTRIRVDVTPGMKGVPDFDSPQGDQPQEVILEILGKMVANAELVLADTKIRTYIG